MPEKRPTTLMIGPREIYKAAYVQGRVARENGDHDMKKIVRAAGEFADALLVEDTAHHMDL